MGTVSEIQHRQKITIWVEDKNNFDYYLAEESFLNCFTDIEITYRCIHNDRYNKYDRSENNIYLIPIFDLEEVYSKLNDICFYIFAFLASNNIKIIIGCGHLSINKPVFDSIIPNHLKKIHLKVLCNDSKLNDNRIISINSFPVKLWNFHGPRYIQDRKLNVLKNIDHDTIIDDKEWWNTEEMEKSAVVKITNKDHIWKALMIGQPFVCDFDHGYNLEEMGFKEYPWIKKKVDKMFVRKNSYFINEHNKENFNKIVKENNNYAIFAKEVFTF